MAMISTTDASIVGTPAQPRRRPRQGHRRRAQYAAEFAAADLLHGYVVSERASPRAGSPRSTPRRPRPCPAWSRSSRTRTGPRTRLARPQATRTRSAPPGSPFRPLYDDKILFSGQPVALVVAETFEAGALRRLAGRGSTTRPSRTRPTSTAAQADGLRAARRSAPASRRRRRRAATPTAPSPRRRSRSSTSTASRPSTTTRWRCTPRPWSGRATASSRSTTRRRASQNSQGYLAGVFGLSKDDVRVLNALSSAAPSARACGRNTSSSSP